jgi:CcmD family protein
MSGETLLVVAYAVVWAVLIGYVVLLARRLTKLEAELRALRASQEAPASSSSTSASADPS